MTTLSLHKMMDSEVVITAAEKNPGVMIIENISSLAVKNQTKCQELLKKK